MKLLKYYLISILAIFLSTLSLARALPEHPFTVLGHTQFSQNEIDKILNFLETHSTDIDFLFKLGQVPQWDTWEDLGSGVTKSVYAHEDLKNYVIKIPRSNILAQVYWYIFGRNFKTEFSRTVYVQDLISKHQFTHLKIPKIIFVESPFGQILIAERISYMNSVNFQKTYTYDFEERQSAYNEFKKLIILARICDVEFGGDVYQNGGWFEGVVGEDSRGTKVIGPAIGIIDLDCVGESQGSMY